MKQCPVVTAAEWAHPMSALNKVLFFLSKQPHLPPGWLMSIDSRQKKVSEWTDGWRRLHLALMSSGGVGPNDSETGSFRLHICQLRKNLSGVVKTCCLNMISGCEFFWRQGQGWTTGLWCSFKYLRKAWSRHRNHGQLKLPSVLLVTVLNVLIMRQDRAHNFWQIPSCW